MLINRRFQPLSATLHLMGTGVLLIPASGLTDHARQEATRRAIRLLA